MDIPAVSTMFRAIVSGSDDSDKVPLGGAAGRKLLEQELDKPIYQERHSFLRELIDKLMELFSGSRFNPDLPSFNWVVVAVTVAVLVVGITLLLTSSSWRAHGAADTRKTKDSVVFDDNRSAIQYLAAAKAAVGREDFSTAFLEQFRHLLKACEGEGKLIITPGLTAFEGSQKLSQVAPLFSAELDWAAGQFNASRFGHRQVLLAHYERLRALDEALERQIKTNSQPMFPSAKGNLVVAPATVGVGS